MILVIQRTKRRTISHASSLDRNRKSLKVEIILNNKAEIILNSLLGITYFAIFSGDVFTCVRSVRF